jgi:hypothetical protein
VSVNIRGDNKGIIQVTIGRRIERISANLERIDESGADTSDIAVALRELTNGTASDQTLRDEDKADALEYLEQLSASAGQEHADENLGKTKTVIRALGGVLSASESLSSLWDTWSASVMDYFATR